MEDKLEKTFNNVNSWLIYSEAKNGVLLALNGAMLLGYLALLKDAEAPLKDSITWCLIPSFTLSLIVILTSFLPIRDKFITKQYNLNEENTKGINLIFYGDLRKLSVELYLELMYQSYNKTIPTSYNKSEKDLANQILINSTITFNKLGYFTAGAYINLIGISSGITMFLIKNYS